MERCKLPCRYFDKKYLVAMCNEEDGFVDIEADNAKLLTDDMISNHVYARSSIWVTQKNPKYAPYCNIEADIVVPDEKEKVMIKALKKLRWVGEDKRGVIPNQKCRVTDVHTHYNTKHLHMLCEGIKPNELNPLVDKMLELHSQSWR